MGNPKIELVLQKLKNGESLVHVEGGNSMAPKIKHREPVVLAPADPDSLHKGDIVFFRVRGSYKTHIIWAIKCESGKNRYLITNIKGKRGVWVGSDNIFGKVVAIGKQACDTFSNEHKSK